MSVNNVSLAHGVIDSPLLVGGVRGGDNLELEGGDVYQVEIVNNGGYAFSAKSKDYEFLIDVKGKGVTPPDTLLAGLGSCVGVYVRKYAEGAGLVLGEFSVSVSADFRKEAPVYFENINISIDLKGTLLDERRKNALLDFVKNCPVHNTLVNKPQILLKIV